MLSQFAYFKAIRAGYHGSMAKIHGGSTPLVRRVAKIAWLDETEGKITVT